MILKQLGKKEAIHFTSAEMAWKVIGTNYLFQFCTFSDGEFALCGDIS